MAEEEEENPAAQRFSGWQESARVKLSAWRGDPSAPSEWKEGTAAQSCSQQMQPGSTERVKNCPGPFQRGDIWVTSSGAQTGLGVKCPINVNGAGLGKGISSTCLWKWKIHPGSDPFVLQPSSREAKHGRTV